jgi:hypothetical protein
MTFAQAVAIHHDGGRNAIRRAVECEECRTLFLAIYGQNP